MRIPKPHPVWAMPVLALAGMLYPVGRVIDVLLMILVGTALVGMYRLRRFARAELLYQPLADGRRPHPSGRQPAAAVDGQIANRSAVSR